ncbi:MAG: alpha/beta hydrolase [Chthoniobacterales bacterium]
MKRFFISILVTVVMLVAIVGLAIAFGGPGEPGPMPSVNNPFQGVDFSDLPKVRYCTARDSTQLAYRFYPAAGGAHEGSVVLVHGSSASSSSMHVMAKGFAAAHYDVYAPDVRGHGKSGTKGQIAYIGQLENDMEDFVHAIKLAQPSTLIGFSSGGGFGLRFAGSSKQKLFSNYLLLAPFISPDSPTARPDSGGWVSVGVPRIIALSVLSRIGVHVFEGLPVIRFALTKENATFLTPEYSFALALNFGAERDYPANIRAVRQPLRVLVGQNDEVSFADKFAGVFKEAGKDIPVTILPGVDHISLTLNPVAIQTAVNTVEDMDRERPNQPMQAAAGRRTLKLPMIQTPLPAATLALIRSHPLTYRYPRGFSVYVAVPQTAPFAPGGSSYSR